VAEQTLRWSLQFLTWVAAVTASAGGCYHPAGQTVAANSYLPCPPGTPRFTGDTIVVSQAAASLKGRVLDFRTGAPVRWASVQWVGATTSTVADEAGFFQMPVDTPGTYRLRVRFIGYIWYTAVVRWKPVARDSASAVPDTTVALPVRLLDANCGFVD